MYDVPILRRFIILHSNNRFCQRVPKLSHIRTDSTRANENFAAARALNAFINILQHLLVMRCVSHIYKDCHIVLVQHFRSIRTFNLA